MMDSTQSASKRYQREIIEYKIKTLLIDKEARFLDTSVEDQMEAVLKNLLLNETNASNLIVGSKPGMARRVYSKLKKFKCVRGFVRILKAIKRRMERHRFLRPIVKIVTKILK